MMNVVMEQIQQKGSNEIFLRSGISIIEGPEGFICVTPNESTINLETGNQDQAVTGNSIVDEKKQTLTYSMYDESLEVQVNKQIKVAPKVSQNNKWTSAWAAVVKEYMTPSNFYEGEYKYQFLDLSIYVGVDNKELGDYLKGKGILSGKEQSYIDAAKRYSVNEIYLVAHSILETGNGTSTLANGVKYNGTTVYNMFGIRAVDNNPIYSGAKYAYEMGWTSPEKAIEGGAKWLSEQYINHKVYRQNTLYKMRWNPASPATHQYATDVGWAIKQVAHINEIYEVLNCEEIVFEIPIYK